MCHRATSDEIRIELPDRVRIHEPQRKVFWFKECLLYPHVGVGWESPDQAESGGLRAHKHDEGIEISYFVQGQVTWRVNGEDFNARRGDVFITLPGERHGGLNDVKEPCERYYLELIVPSEDQPLPGLTTAETRSLAEAFAAVGSHVFPGNEAVGRLFERLVSIHEAHGHAASGSLAALDARTVLHRLLLEVLQCADEASKPGTGDGQRTGLSPEVATALDWIDRNLARNFDVPSVARRAGLSISAFHRRFLQEVGMTPSEYRTRRRIDEARALLARSERSITAVAHGLGFSTSQYFATVFRKYVGITPREFRNSTQVDAPGE